jgi:hypothetical protein
MKLLKMALAALAALAMGSAPLAAHAADKEKPGAITKDQRDKGMKQAPALAKSAGIACTVADAYFLGTSNGKDAKQDVYEVACQEGLGYVLLSSGATTKAYDCLATKAQPTLTCKLPANANPVDGLKGFVTKAGVACTTKDGRYIGTSASSGQTVYEVACQEGPGYILQTSASAVTAIPCAAAQGQGNMECSLTTKDQINAYLQGLVAKSGKQCQISASHYIGVDKNSGDAYYEVGCGQQAGFVLDTDKTGAYKTTVSCAQAQGLGGCTLTDTTKIATEEVATYTKLAKDGGFNCDVSKYRAIGMDANKNEVVELACSNRPDGVVALFPSAAGGKAEFIDCVRSGQFGNSGTCQLSKPTTVYAKLSAALAAKGRSSCKVSDARYLGRSQSGTDFLETACSDGAPGWVLEVDTADNVKQLLSCGQAKSAGLSCQMPTNQEGKK